MFVETISCVVSGILQLLCGKFDENVDKVRRDLMDIWFPSDGLGPKVYIRIIRIFANKEIRKYIKNIFYLNFALELGKL